MDISAEAKRIMEAMTVVERMAPVGSHEQGEYKRHCFRNGPIRGAAMNRILKLLDDLRDTDTVAAALHERESDEAILRENLEGIQRHRQMLERRLNAELRASQSDLYMHWPHIRAILLAVQQTGT